MKLINFEDKSCEKYRKRLDVYLSNELTEEIRLETLRHLERCPRCAEELETKQRLKDALRRTVNRDEPAPEDLRQRILKQLDPQSSRTGRNYWWLAAAATVVLSAGVFGMWRWLYTPHPNQPETHPLHRPDKKE